MKITIHNPARIAEIKARLAVHDAWVNSIRTKNGCAQYKPEERIAAGIPDVSNEERSAVEVTDFCENPPDKYFLYVSEEKRLATTFTGESLGAVTFGRTWYDNFNGQRASVRIRAINGHTYAGTYFKSAGDYARVKRCKA